jgi:hypothetical protein
VKFGDIAAVIAAKYSMTITEETTAQLHRPESARTGCVSIALTYLKKISQSHNETPSQSSEKNATSAPLKRKNSERPN